MNRSACQAILDGVLRASRADETQVLLSSVDSALTRFANNEIHQNVAEEGVSLTVQVRVGDRTAWSSTDRLDRAALQAVLDRAIALASVMPQRKRPPRPGPQRYPALERFHSGTARLTPGQRARLVSDVVGRARASGLTAAGFLANQLRTVALANSSGLNAFGRYTQAEFSVTIYGEDSSGWAKGFAPSIDELSIEELAQRALQKALLGRSPRQIPPGRYPVILEPAAVADLLGFLGGDFSALEVHQKQSCLTDRIGTRVFGENITLVDDWSHPLQLGVGFDGDGLPKKRTLLVENGVVREMVYSLSTAHRLGKAPTGHGLFFEEGEYPFNMVMMGGTVSLEEMVEATDYGILVSRLWYIREVDRSRKILTGMTRDGTFLIESGRVTGGVRNFRFNQSLIELLNHVRALGPAVRAAGEEHYGFLVVPPIQVESLHFTEATLF